IEEFVGSATAGGTLTGPNAANAWSITGTDGGTLNGTAFSDFGDLVGGSNVDTFTFQSAGSVSGSITGGGGANEIKGPNAATTFTTPGASSGGIPGRVPSFSNVQPLTGGSAGDSFDFQGGSVSTVNGGGGTDTITGPDAATTWNVTAANAGSVPGVVS